MHSLAKGEGRQAKATVFQTGTSFYLGQKKVHHTLGKGLLSYIFSGNAPIDMPRGLPISWFQIQSSFQPESITIGGLHSSTFTTLNQHPRADLQVVGHPLWKELWSGRIGGEAGERLVRSHESWIDAPPSGTRLRQQMPWGYSKQILFEDTLCMVSISPTAVGPVWGWRVRELHWMQILQTELRLKP